MFRLTIFLALAACANAWTTGFCNDKDASCGGWAKAGECTGDNAEFMTSNCRA